MDKRKNKIGITAIVINLIAVLVGCLIVVGYFYRKKYDVSELYMRITTKKIEKDIKDYDEVYASLEMYSPLKGKYSYEEGFDDVKVIDYEIAVDDDDNDIKVKCDVSYENKLGILYVNNALLYYNAKGLFNVTYSIQSEATTSSTFKYVYNTSPYMTPRQLMNFVNNQEGTDYIKVETVLLASAGEKPKKLWDSGEYYYCVDDLGSLEYYVQFGHNALSIDYIWVDIDWNDNTQSWDVVTSKFSTKKIQSEYSTLGITNYMKADTYLDDAQMDTICDVSNQLITNHNE